MKNKLEISLALLVLAVLVGCANRQAATTSSSQAQGDPATGKTIFDANCASCHGTNGERISGWKSSVKQMSMSQVETRIRNGGGGMPAFKDTLSDQQIKDVAAYAKQLASSGGDPSGQAIFDQNCAVCHGKDGNKISDWKSRVRHMTVAQVKHQIRDGGGGMPPFKDKLSAQDIDKVADYAKKLASK